jgi:hypothetical protein
VKRQNVLEKPEKSRPSAKQNRTTMKSLRTHLPGLLSQVLVVWAAASQVLEVWAAFLLEVWVADSQVLEEVCQLVLWASCHNS